MILALDIGTTNCKALLLDQHLHIVSKSSREYGFDIPKAGWAEQHPDQWWNAVKAALKDILKNADTAQIKAIGLSGQMHGLVALDASGTVIRPCILWNDQRSAPQCQTLYETLGGKNALLQHTNNAMLPGYTGGKILWLRDNEPEHYAQIAHVLLPKDYMRYRLTGELGTDVSDASGTGFFNVRKREWAGDLLDRLEMPPAWFPQAVDSLEIVGKLQDMAAVELGLPAGIPVTAGGGDACMQVVGSGIADPDTVLTVIGTGGNVTVPLPTPIDNPNSMLQVFCYCVPEQWVGMGVTLTAGSSLKWFRDVLGQEEVARAAEQNKSVYALFNDRAAQSPPGSNGLMFLPYLLGERCPHTDPDARGSWLGIGMHTTKNDLLRSIYEGVAFSLFDVLSVIEQAGIKPGRICASGGGAQSRLWRQMQADIFNRNVVTVADSEDASALGAGIVAGVGVGFWPSFSDAVSHLNVQTTDAPDPAIVAIYQNLNAIYRKLYPALQPIFHDMAARESEP